MIVFRPFVGEIISAKLKESTADGLHCMFNSYFRISFVSIFSSSFFDSTIFFYIAIFPWHDKLTRGYSWRRKLLRTASVNWHDALFFISVGTEL